MLTKLIRFQTYLVLLLGLFWSLTSRVATGIDIGILSLNAYLTMIAFLASAGLSAATAWRLLQQARKADSLAKRSPSLAAIIGASSGIPFFLYALLRLIVDPRIEGAQSTLVWGVFAFSVFGLSLSISRSEISRIFSVVTPVVLLVSGMKILEVLIGIEILGQSVFAITSTILMAIAVAKTPRHWLDWVGPWALFFAILLAQVRLPGVLAGLLLLFLVRHVSGGLAKKIAVSAVVLSGAGISIWSFVGDKFLSRASVPPEPTILGPLELVGTSRRGEFWTMLFEQTSLGENWWGEGAGLSSVLVDGLFGQNHPHNEYVRIWFDFGWIGLALFLGTTLALLTVLFRAQKKQPTDLNLAAILAVLMIGAFSLTDNVVLYVMAMLPAAIIVSSSLASLRLSESLQPNDRTNLLR